MSTEKKVIFLFLLLVIVIISCVYVHAPKIAEARNIVVSQTNDKEIEPVITDEDKEVEVTASDLYDQSKNEADLTLSENSSQEETSVHEFGQEATDKIVEKEPGVDFNKLSESETQEKTEVIEPQEVQTAVKEEPKEVKPLITTDKRYVRAEGEKPIEKLSIEAQKLQIELNKLMRENPIIFKRASYNVTTKSENVIQTVAKILREYPTLVIEVAGHTDAAGEAKLNKYISNERAKVVRKRLIELGIEANRLIARGYGEDIPLVKNSPKGYSKINRRVEFNIVEE